MDSIQNKSKSSLQSPTKASSSTNKAAPAPSTSKAQNPDAPVTKRLHISGLTPAITLDDLNKRLSTFGTVEAVDGMGMVDAVGRPRAFAYVTLNTNVGKLSRCMNVLSGSTWKGAKLRIAEAKPDYRERLAAEREAAASTAELKPKRKRQRLDGVHAADMTPVTPSSAVEKSGWKVTEMGRVLRTIRVRPDHPLPPTLEEKAKAKSAVAASGGSHYTKGKQTKTSGEKGKGGKGKDGEEKRKRKKDPMVRARRVTIDVTKWESTLLKGMFLESQGVGKVGGGKGGDILPEESRESEEEGESDEETSEGEEEEDEEMEEEEKRKPAPEPQTQPTVPAPSPPKPSVLPPQPSPTLSPPPKSLSTTTPDGTTSIIAHETSAALDLLSSLFGNADDDDDAWARHDAMDSDIDEEEILKAEVKARENVERSGANVNVGKGDGEFEVVPREKSTAGTKRKVEEVVGEGEDEEEVDEVLEEGVDDVSAQEPGARKEDSRPAAQAAAPNLKDLFAPREEEAGFSLLGHLDLDLEVDEELAFAFEGAASITTPAEGPTYTPAVSLPISSIQTHAGTAAAGSTYINPREPLFFFPFPSSLSSHTSPSTEWKNSFHLYNPSKKTRDAVDVMVDKGWYWRDPKVKFYRTESEEDIRKKWEEARGELTRGWKRRAREAGKVGRRAGRRGGGRGEDV